jgi:hypothetical protein
VPLHRAVKLRGPVQSWRGDQYFHRMCGPATIDGPAP